jgi:hypothetical protein
MGQETYRGVAPIMRHFRVHPPGPSGVLEPPVLVDDTHREVSDFYLGVITYLDPRWRVVICKDRIQYILQYRSSKHLNKGMWLGKSYPTTRDALRRICSSRGLLSDPNARALLEALPERARDYVRK